MINDAAEANRSVRADIVALDPSCALPELVVATGAADDIVFCRAGKAGPGRKMEALSLKEAEPALAVIEALTSYLDAVDTIVSRGPLELVKIAEEAETDLAASRFIYVFRNREPFLAYPSQLCQSSAVGEVRRSIAAIGSAARLYSSANGDTYSLCLSGAGRQIPPSAAVICTYADFATTTL